MPLLSHFRGLFFSSCKRPPDLATHLFNQKFPRHASPRNTLESVIIRFSFLYSSNLPTLFKAQVLLFPQLQAVCGQSSPGLGSPLSSLQMPPWSPQLSSPYLYFSGGQITYPLLQPPGEASRHLQHPFESLPMSNSNNSYPMKSF